MSTTAGEQGQQQQQQKQDSPQGNNSGASSPSSSISLVRLDELSSFGATKQQRLPALIKLNPLADQQQQQQANSMPDFSGSQVEKTGAAGGKQAESLPAGLVSQGGGAADKENAPDNSDDFQVVNMEEGEELEGGNAGSAAAAPAAGPSLPAPKSALVAESLLRGLETDSLSAQLLSTNLATGQYASHLGDSLIEMIINLRNENQNLVRALETNNEYVKERLSEFKRCQEEAKRRELQHAAEKADFEHQARKLRRQNGLLSERLKSLESKLAELNVEVGQSLEAAHSSRASSVRDASDLYPQLAGSDEESFSNAALAAGQPRDQLATMQMDATSGELYNQGDQPAASSSTKDAQMDTTGDGEGTKRGATEALKVGAMGQEELARRFDADKQSAFYALDDPMKQCDQLEQQLNDIGRRDYEICLLQQQLNIYRQDFRLERMAKLEARIQIEKLKNDIDRLCLARLQEQRGEQAGASSRVHFAAGEQQQQQQGNLIGKLGHQLGRKAVKSAAKAAKYAAKQAHLEEKAAAALARAAAAKAAAASHFAPPRPASDLSGASSAPPAATTIAGDSSGGATSDSGGRGHHQNHHHAGHHHHHFGRHHRHQRGASAGGGGRPAGLRSEVMNDLLTTANKAMLTGYKMASTHVNLALDKLSQYEQQQASQLEANSRPPIQTAAKAAAAGPSAPPMEPPSID